MASIGCGDRFFTVGKVSIGCGGRFSVVGKVSIGCGGRFSVVGNVSIGCGWPFFNVGKGSTGCGNLPDDDSRPHPAGGGRESFDIWFDFCISISVLFVIPKCLSRLLSEPVYPLRDVAEHFGRDGFLNLAVLVNDAGGAVLEEVVQPGVFLRDVLLRLSQQPLDGRQV